MILFDSEIKRAMGDGDIIIDPFIPENLGVNSYDVRLGSNLLVYKRLTGGDYRYLDMRKKNNTRTLAIPEGGMVLEPEQLYLGHTVESVGTRGRYVPHLEGRSSVGRLGMTVHVTAGFGDCGFEGSWTLEIVVVHPLKVYAGERIAQVYFLEGKGVPEKLYAGKYRDAILPVQSMMFADRRP